HHGVGLRGGGGRHAGRGTRALARADPASRALAGDGAVGTGRSLVAPVDAAGLDEPHLSGGLHHLVDARPERSDPARSRAPDRAAAGSRAGRLRGGDARRGFANLPRSPQRAIASRIPSLSTWSRESTAASLRAPARPCGGDNAWDVSNIRRRRVVTFAMAS